MSCYIKGFINQTYNGHPVWIRKEYEKYHHHESELERLSEFLGYYPDSLDMAISKARDKDVRLVYKRYSSFIDNALENQYGRKQFQWVNFSHGYINVITYEYVEIGIKPTYSGLPFWCKKNYSSYQSAGERQSILLKELLSYLLAVIFVNKE